MSIVSLAAAVDGVCKGWQAAFLQVSHVDAAEHQISGCDRLTGRHPQFTKLIFISDHVFLAASSEAVFFEFCLCFLFSLFQCASEKTTSIN